MIKPTSIRRINTITRKWVLTREDLDAIICKHLGIPMDSNTVIALREFRDTEITHVEVINEGE
jgi:hypothetical protein